jgi:hypothetical protein
MALLLFYKFFGKLNDNLVWIYPTATFGMFISNGPINMVIGLELLAIMFTVVAIRFLRDKTSALDNKRLLLVFILNLISFLILFVALSDWATTNSITGAQFWNIKTRTAVLVYYTIKFGTITSAVLKSYFYEALPLQLLVFITILQSTFIPILVYQGLSSIINIGSLVGALVFLVANVPALSKVLEGKNISLLLAYTTAITNA